MAGHPSASAKDDAARRLIFARSATKPRPYPTCTAASRPVHLGVIILSLSSTGNLKTPSTRTLPPTNAASLYSVSSAGFSPAVRTILIATTPSFKSAGPKFSKAIFQMSGAHYCMRVSSGEREEGHYAQANYGRSSLRWKDGYTVAHAPGDNMRQPRQIQRTHSTRSTTTSERAYAHVPIMLAHDRRVLAILEERLQQSRISDLSVWAKTMLPVINQSVHDARAQLHTGHQDIRFFSPTRPRWPPTPPRPPHLPP
jgi:hypothetical protein